MKWLAVALAFVYFVVGGLIGCLMLPFAMMAATDGPKTRPAYMLLPIVAVFAWPLLMLISVVQDRKYKR